MIRPTGLRRATVEQRARVPLYDGTRVSYRPRAGTSSQQGIARIINQRRLPACVGCAMCAGVEAVLGIPPNFSWVRIWTDARRRDGTLDDPDAGTWFASAIESVTKRGLDPEEDGEWDRLEEQTEPDDLDSEMAAYDRRQIGTERWRAPAGDLDAVEDALRRGLIIGIASGVRTQYFDFFDTARSPADADIVLTNEALGGYQNGHEQRLIAVDYDSASRRTWVIQNSWGRRGGCHLPDGSFALGCAKVDDSVLRSSWDLDIIEIKS